MNKYTEKINIPQYIPKEKNKPSIEKMYDLSKYKKLIENIENSNVTEKEKEFLKISATRHIVFNYKNIAEYYAHSDAKMQRLMEESALVIIDVNDAIKNGYASFSKRMKDKFGK